MNQKTPATSRLMRLATGVLLITLTGCANSNASEVRPVDRYNGEFQPVTIAPRAAKTAPPVMYPTPAVTAAPRPVVEPQAKSEPIVTPAPPVRVTGRSVSGTATWYCVAGVSVCHYQYNGGMYAAAGSELRIGDWRGRKVVVCAGSDCISVRLIDWCACAGARVIDLYGDAFRQLAPLSRGVIPVTVTW